MLYFPTSAGEEPPKKRARLSRTSSNPPDSEAAMYENGGHGSPGGSDEPAVPGSDGGGSGEDAGQGARREGSERKTVPLGGDWEIGHSFDELHLIFSMGIYQSGHWDIFRSASGIVEEASGVEQSARELADDGDGASHASQTAMSVQSGEDLNLPGRGPMEIDSSGERRGEVKTILQVVLVGQLDEDHMFLAKEMVPGDETGAKWPLVVKLSFGREGVLRLRHEYKVYQHLRRYTEAKEHIPPVHGVFIQEFEGDQVGALVLSWVAGTPATKLTSKRLTRIWPQVEDTIGKIHEAGVVHRNLALRNIIVDRGEVTVLDFGRAKVTQNEQMRARDWATLDDMKPDEEEQGQEDNEDDNED